MHVNRKSIRSYDELRNQDKSAKCCCHFCFPQTNQKLAPSMLKNLHICGGLWKESAQYDVKLNKESNKQVN